MNKELTKEQLAMVRAAMNKHLPGECIGSDFDKVLAELTPKPKFTVGQVVYCMDLEDDQPTGFYAPESQLTDIGVRDARPLNQAEVSDSWVPRAEFERLRDGAERARKKAVDSKFMYNPYSDLKLLLDSLPEELKP